MSDVVTFRTPITRDMVIRAENEMRERGVPVDIPVTHRFANKGTKRGVYAREIAIPAGTMLTGHIHKYEQINFLLKGAISVLMEDGRVKLIEAPATVVSPAGTKRIAYTHTDVVWTTVHATENEDLKLIEAECIAHTEQEFLDFVKALPLKEAACLG